MFHYSQSSKNAREQDVTKSMRNLIIYVVYAEKTQQVPKKTSALSLKLNLYLEETNKTMMAKI